MARFGKRSNRTKAGLHYILQEILNEAIKTTTHDFGLHEGQRPLAKQYQYFLDGKSHIDGYTRRGYHNYTPALAFDFHCSVTGNTWDNKREEVDGDPAYLEEIARHIQKIARDKFGIKLQWGGDWRTLKDGPHLQLPGRYRKEAEFKKLY